jgi:hypothetical protein
MTMPGRTGRGGGKAEGRREKTQEKEEPDVHSVRLRLPAGGRSRRARSEWRDPNSRSAD